MSDSAPSKQPWQVLRVAALTASIHDVCDDIDRYHSGSDPERLSNWSKSNMIAGADKLAGRLHQLYKDGELQGDFAYLLPKVDRLWAMLDERGLIPSNLY